MISIIRPYNKGENRQRINSEDFMALAEGRKELNALQKDLRTALSSGQGHPTAIQKFLDLHGILHSKSVAPLSPWSYEDLLLNELTESDFRTIPDGEEHSIIWIVWHLSRIEDVTMNLLVADREQVFEKGGWLRKTRSPIKHTGNGTGVAVTAMLSESVDVHALRAYRFAVGRATRKIVKSLSPADLNRKMTSRQLQRILDEGAVVQEGIGVVEYWGRRNVTGLLLMPPTRHTIIHWNEAR